MDDSNDNSTRVDRLLAELSVEEKASLCAGGGMFHLAGVERLGIPSWPVTDGPNGARGSSLLGAGEAIALCIPCGSALGATWDPALIERLGDALGAEARTKQAAILLAPTVNLHRSPLAGRNFECFSEDPLLSGRAAAAYVRGVQAQGVGTTVKHFVGNESETHRYTTDSRIDERTLRELYLLPFEIAVREGGALGVMTSYNRLNGGYLTDDHRLVTEVLRGEWGFEGIVMTDWFAAIETESAAAAGVDVEMPAGGPAYGSHLAAAVQQGRVSEATLDAMVHRILTVLDRLGALDREPAEERNETDPDHRELARDAAAGALVLLKNDPVGPAPLLPLDPTMLTTVAVIGPNAFRPQIMGGGSAALRPQYRYSPLEAIDAALGDDVEVRHVAGGSIERNAGPMMAPLVHGPAGSGDLPLEIIAGLDPDGPVVRTTNSDQTKLVFGDPPTDEDPTGYSARLSGVLKAPVTGNYRFEMTQVAEARFVLADRAVCDAYGVELARGDSFFGSGSVMVEGSADLVEGVEYPFVLEMSAPLQTFSGVQLGVHVPESDDPVGDSATLAASCDVAIVVVGTNDDWESEGWDRTTLDLPGTQNELVRRVLGANPRTVVVLNTGAPVHLPWAEAVPALLQTWFGGQGMAEALADVLVGRREPGGRLPTTFPVRMEHAPSHGNFPGSNGVVRYGEQVFIGYRWYEERRLPVAFPFGHGLSYTRFEIGEPTVSAGLVSPDAALQVTVPVTNVGDRPGSEVVQVYVAPHPSANPAGPPRPPKTLQGFAKVTLAAGETAAATVEVPPRAFARWNDPDRNWTASVEARKPSLRMFPIPEFDPVPGWVVDPGRYDIVVATSSECEIARVPVVAEGDGPIHLDTAP